MSRVLEPWLSAELALVGETNAFPGPDRIATELAAIHDAHPGVTSLDQIGRSRLQDPLWCLSIGEGESDVLVVGLPHPNEPIGALTTLHLARRLCQDSDLRHRLGHHWHLVPCIDPDGLRLNEGWLGNPTERAHYARHFYRSAGDEQIEWTFPVDHGRLQHQTVLPETRAWMELIDRVQPTVMCSMHNSELGGAYYYVTRPEPALHPVLQAIPQHLGLPLHRGEAEAPWLTRHADGIFQMPSLVAAHDHMVEAGQDLAVLDGAGDTSDSYAQKYGTFTLLPELPYWADQRMADSSVTATRLAAALRTHAQSLRSLADVLGDALEGADGDTVSDSPFLRASRFFIPGLATLPASTLDRADSEDVERHGTVAELATLNDTVHSYRLRFGGMLLRALDGEMAIGNATPAIRRHRENLGVTYDAWCDEESATSQATAIPIGSLVASQYGAVLATATHLHDPGTDQRPL